MPLLKQAECHNKQVWCAWTQHSPQQDKRRHSRTVYLRHHGADERVLLLPIPPLQSSYDGLHLKKSGKSEAQMWTWKGVSSAHQRHDLLHRSCLRTGKGHADMLSSHRQLLAKHGYHSITLWLGSFGAATLRKHLTWSKPCWVHGNKDNTANKGDGALNLTNLNKLKMQKATIFPWLQLRPEGYIETFRSNSESCCYFCKIQPEILLILKRFCEQLALLNSLLLFFFSMNFKSVC